jgi:hypothetical protein
MLKAVKLMLKAANPLPKAARQKNRAFTCLDQGARSTEEKYWRRTLAKLA